MFKMTIIKILTPEQIRKAKIIKNAREESNLNDNESYKNKREAWLDKLNLLNSTTHDLSGFENFEVWEMWNSEPEPLKTKSEKYQFFNPKFNTRTKINSETCFEIDKLEFEKAINIMCEVILSLIRSNFHFAVFFAEGQRSPHIRVYDLEELNDLDPKQRIKAQIEFWRRHVPFGLFQYGDSGMFVDNHPLQMEFAPHWKYKTIFDLLFERLPKEEEKCKV